MAIETAALVRYLDELLDASSIKDYCPNGLQVEGSPVVSRAVCAVTASLAAVSYTHLTLPTSDLV